MEVKGDHEFQISREKLWAYLMDPDVLAKITPGVTKLEILDNDLYKSVSDIKIGPVRGSFSGKLKVVNKNQPESFAIEMEQLSKIGNAHATVNMMLGAKGDQASTLAFEGNAKLSGVIARTGQRVLSGVANAITKEVFASLEKHIEENKSDVPKSEAMAAKEKPTAKALAGTAADLEPASTARSRVESTNQTTTNSPKSSGGFFAAIINFFKRLFGRK